MLRCDFRSVVAGALAGMMVFASMPVSAADKSASRTVLGSVNAVGPVELRGFSISQEGTLFAGDSIRAREKGYAKVLLGNGTKLELAEKTEIRVSPDNQGVQIALNAGTIGFTAHKPVRIDVQPFEIIAADDAAGSVAVMGSASAGVRSIKGNVTVRNLKTSESFVLLKGQE